jgi:hypothetical protein
MVLERPLPLGVVPKPTDARNYEKVYYKITKWQKYSQNTTIFISYEWVDHIAVSASIGHRQVVLLPICQAWHIV